MDAKDRRLAAQARRIAAQDTASRETPDHLVDSSTKSAVFGNDGSVIDTAKEIVGGKSSNFF